MEAPERRRENRENHGIQGPSVLLAAAFEHAESESSPSSHIGAFSSLDEVRFGKHQNRYRRYSLPMPTTNR